MELDNGDMIGHFPCIANEIDGKRGCSSSDALAVYEHKTEDGILYDGYCYSCCQTFKPEQIHNSSIAVNLGIKDGVIIDLKNFVKKPKAEPLTKQQVIDFIKKTGYVSNNYRGIKDEYSKFFGHLTKLDTNGNVLARYYPETQGTSVTGYKCRNHPKDFRYGKLGLTGQSCDLSGQIKFQSGGKYVLIVGGECYSDDTEILTDKGWKYFNKLNTDDKVMQVCNGIGDFVTPISYIRKEYKGLMTHYSGRYNDLMVTPNHKMVSVNSKNEEYFHLAKDIPSVAHKYRKAIIHNGNGISLTDDQIRFIIAVAADCKVDTRKSGKRVAHFSFIKERKITRLKEILESLHLEYTEYNKENRNWKCGRKYHTFNVVLPYWVEFKGLPLNWVTDMSAHQKTLFLDEIIYWDGNFVKNRNAFEFSSKLKHEADMVVTMAVTSGRHATVRLRKNDLGEWYAVRVSNDKNTSSYQNIKFNNVEYDGFVYCVEVPSGQLLVRRNNKIVVCGNCDKVAAFQMLRDNQLERGQSDYDPIAVVSPTTGEPSAIKQIAQQYDFLNSFETIVLGFDNDEAGREATRTIAEILPEDKVKIAVWSGKDPNKMLQDGKDKQFLRDFYGAKNYVEDGVVTSKEADTKIEEELARPKIKLPEFMKQLQKMMAGGLPLGYWVNWIAMTGIGKSTTVNEAIREWVYNSPYKVGILSLELTDAQYMIAMLSREVGYKINLIEDPQAAVDFVKQPNVVEARIKLKENEVGEERFVILDDREGTLSHVKKQIEKLIKKHGCRLIVIDPINDLFDGASQEDQAAFIKWMKIIIKTGVTFSCVCHVRKGQNSTNKDGKRIVRELTEDDVSGLSLITKSAGANIFLNRDKYSEDPVVRNTTNVTMGKCRWTGLSGPAGKWYYCNQEHTMYDFDDYHNSNSGSRTTIEPTPTLIIDPHDIEFDNEVEEESF